MKRRLQDATIQKLKLPAKGKRAEYKDALVPGLMVRITDKGARSFCLVFKVPGEHPSGPGKTGRPRVGKPHRITLGTYPGMSLADAREAARLLLEQVDKGINPQAGRGQAAAAAHLGTVEAAAARFIDQACRGYIKSWRRVERTLEMHVIPALGSMPIERIERADIHKLIDSVSENVGPGAAKEVVKHLHGMFEHSFNRGEIKHNPAHRLKRKDLRTNGDAGRALTDAELKAIWKAAGEIGYPHGDWIKLLMLTGQRRGDWANAQRSEIDFDSRALCIPADRYKTGIDHSVPLGAVAQEIVAGLPRWNAGDYLFSTTSGSKPINSAGSAKNKIDFLAPTDKPWRIHDFRVTAKSRMADLGIDPAHSEAVLGHTKKGMDAIYNKHEYLDAKRAALAAYETHLMGIVG